MARERAAQPRRLRVIKGRPAETPILDLGEGLRIYMSLQNQIQQLTNVAEDLRGRLLRAMEQAKLDDFYADGVHAIRQIRHVAPRLDPERAQRLLEREGRLQDALRTTLDPDKARQVLDELYIEGRIARNELPYTEPREIEALIVRAVEEES
ncbi:MAG: hypothetical protein ACUVX1_15960 [Chloroflexota bacterium]